MVELKASGNTWTGVTFNEQGEIITTSQDLGAAPLADFRFADGVSGQAWVYGRDDNVGLALLRPVAAPRAYPFLSFSSDQPPLNSSMGLVQFNGISTAPDLLDTTITGFQPTLGGCSWLQIRATDSATANGAVVFTPSGKIQGIRMPSGFANVGSTGQVFACASTDIGTTIPLLQSGRAILNPNFTRDTVDQGTIPPIPIIYHGTLTIGGQSAPIGTRIYARLSAAGKPDIWKSRATRKVGEYDFPISVSASGYDRVATIEFWVDAKRAAVTPTYGGGGTSAQPVNQNLAFP